MAVLFLHNWNRAPDGSKLLLFARGGAGQIAARRGSRQRLASIQCLRAIAALVVVLYHLRVFEQKYDPGAVLRPELLEYGQCGVDLFFVISGYIMTTITERSFRMSGAAARFLRGRCLRIFPLYWVYALLALAAFLIHPEWVNAHHGRPDLVRSLLLLPQRNLPLLMVAWTLTYELFFYLVFAAVMRAFDRSRLPLALAAWAAITTLLNLVLSPSEQQPFLHVLLSPLVLEFIAGCALALLPSVLSSAGTGWLLTVAGAGSLLGASLALDFNHAPFPVHGWMRLGLFGTGAMLLVAGLVRLEARASGLFPRCLVALGDASYSLYLSHLLVIAAVGHFWARLLASPSAVDHVAGLLVALGAALLAGLLGYRYLEAPLVARLRRPPRLRTLLGRG